MEAALAYYRQALRLRPHYPEAYCNVGNALQAQEKNDEAIVAYQQALRQKPDYADAHYNLGIAWHDQGKIDEAIACFRQTLLFKPDLPEAHYNLGVSLLLRGDFAEGWQKYEWRWRTRECKGATDISRNRCGKGSSCRTARFCCTRNRDWAIPFSSSASPPWSKQRVGTVLCECPSVLVRLLRSCAGIDRIIPHGEPLPPFDVQAPLLSLPAILETTLDTIPALTPYMDCDADLVERWRQRLAALDEHKPSLRVGIVWQGNREHKKDSRRSVRLEQFAPLAELPGVRLISLQKGHGTEQLEKMPGLAVSLGPELIDLTDTAAVLRCLDLVISVDTMVAHLAGALGRAGVGGFIQGARLALAARPAGQSLVSLHASVPSGGTWAVGRGISQDQGGSCEPAAGYDPGGQRREQSGVVISGISGLKGRFCQRRPKAWVPTGGLGYRVKPIGIGLQGRITVVAREPALQAEEYPLRAADPGFRLEPRPSAFADRTGPSGRKCPKSLRQIAHGVALRGRKRSLITPSGEPGSAPACVCLGCGG